MSGKKIIEGLQDAVAYARVDKLWRTTKKKRGEDITPYDWGYRDGVMAARSLFGTEHKVRVAKKSPAARGTFAGIKIATPAVRPRGTTVRQIRKAVAAAAKR